MVKLDKNVYSNVRDNLLRALDAIGQAALAVGRPAEEVKVVAVTKSHPPEAVEAAVEAGLSLIGENRVQEAEAKKASLPGLDAHWIMIGHLQRNKARKALGIFSQVQSLDSPELASAMNRILMEVGQGAVDRPFPVLMEVNISGEASKHGISPHEAQALAEHIMGNCPALSLRGLMGVGPLTDDQLAIRSSFAMLRKIRDGLEAAFGISLPELSMGMSSDFPLAVMEGSTMVRLGSCLFGPRGGILKNRLCIYNITCQWTNHIRS